MKTMNRIFLLPMLCALLTACSSVGDTDDAVWIDVRTVEEYSADHIDGDANIPLATIDPDALASQYGKDAEINLYCRSGNRAGQAMAILQEAGFSNVNNVGGIDDVRVLRSVAGTGGQGASSATAGGLIRSSENQ